MNTLEEGRAAFERGGWSESYRLLGAADAQTPLDPVDLDRLSTAAYLIGEDAVSGQARTRAHAGFLERGEPVHAARSALWLAFTMFEKTRQRAQAAGWLARAQRLLDDVNESCVEQGWLLCGLARQRVSTGDIASAHAAFKEAVEIADRFGDVDLTALARHGQGRTLVAMNDTAAGLALLDEVMVSVAGGEVAPIVTGAVYCSVITACHDLFDLRRAQEWTTALEGWCAAHPDVVPFRGYCLIHRSELMRLHGSWQAAFSEAQRACERLTDPPAQPEAGAAYYQLAELHRLRGEFAKADEAYRLASQAGRNPQPGLALLRLGQGQLDAAAASIRLALQETQGRRTRVLLLSAGVQIMLAGHDTAGARAACDELIRVAEGLDVPFPRAVSLQAHGAVALAEGQPFPALECLRAASATWQELDAPYELAQCRLLIGLVYRHLGDYDGAQLELETAQDTFEKLGAAPAAAHAAALTAQAPAQVSLRAGTGLTGREIEVLRLVATGAKNRTIAGRLRISEKTVARHVSNIFTKLDLSSRAAATAYAYKNRLI